MTQIAKGVLVLAVTGGLSFGLFAQDVSGTAFAEEDNGDLVHQASGLRFPSEISGFHRTEAAVLAGSGEYVGVEYTKQLSIDGTITLRAAVVTIPALTPQAHYVITKPITIGSLGDVRTVAEGPYERVQGSEGYRGLFIGNSGGRVWMRGLWAFERGDWDLRVRADYPRVDQIDADRAVAEFVNALNDANSSI